MRANTPGREQVRRPTCRPSNGVATPTTVATDVWALGVLLFEICAGRRPFDEESFEDQQARVTSALEAPSLTAFVDAPDALGDLIARCLAKVPADRPSAADIVAGLQELVAERRHSTMPPVDKTRAAETGAPDPPSAQPRRWVAPAVALIALAVGAGGAYLLGPTPDASSKATPTPRESAPPESAPPESAPTVVPTALPLPSSRAAVDPRPVSAQPSPSTATSPSAAPATTATPQRSSKPLVKRRRPFNATKAQAQAQELAKMAGRVCRHRKGPRSFNITITFNPETGSPRFVNTHLRYAHKEGQTGFCVKGQMYRTAVEPFAGEPQTVTVGVFLD